MTHELTERQLAIRLRQAGKEIEIVCQRQDRSRAWFSKWGSRYIAQGPESLYGLSPTPRTLVDQIPPHVERMIVSVRRWLEAHATPATRHQRIGAPTIQAESQALQVTPLPGRRTIERVCARHCHTCSALSLSDWLERVSRPS